MGEKIRAGETENTQTNISVKWDCTRAMHFQSDIPTACVQYAFGQQHTWSFQTRYDQWELNDFHSFFFNGIVVHFFLLLVAILLVIYGIAQLCGHQNRMKRKSWKSGQGEELWKIFNWFIKLD